MKTDRFFTLKNIPFSYQICNNFTKKSLTEKAFIENVLFVQKKKKKSKKVVIEDFMDKNRHF